MARSLLLISTVALMAMIARASTSDSDSMWSDSSNSGAPAPTNPFPVVNGCLVKTKNAASKDITVDLEDMAQAANVDVTSGDFSFVFSPCQERSLATCADAEGNGVSVDGNLVVKNKGACTKATDVYVLAAQEPVVYSAADSKWTVKLNNGASNFNVVVECDATAENTVVKSFDDKLMTLTLGDYRVCAQDDSALAPIPVAEGCTTNFKSFDRDFSSTLTGFQQWFDKATTDGTALPEIRVQSCTANAFTETTGPVKGCTGNGFLAFTEGDQCVVLEQRSVLFMPENQTFTSKYFNNAATGRKFAAQNLGAEEDGKIVQVACGTENQYIAEESNADFFSFTSPTVCGTAVAPTDAPTPAPEKKGLSAGAIAGIVIGVIAVIVLIAVGFVCFRSKSRSAEEGEYNRV